VCKKIDAIVAHKTNGVGYVIEIEDLQLLLTKGNMNLEEQLKTNVIMITGNKCLVKSNSSIGTIICDNMTEDEIFNSTYVPNNAAESEEGDSDDYYITPQSAVTRVVKMYQEQAVSK